MKMVGAKSTKSVTLLSVDDPPLFKLQDLCDGLSREQYRIKQITRDKTILSARDRVLSARSKTSDAISLRTTSRFSSVRSLRDVEPDTSILPDIKTQIDNQNAITSVTGSSQDGSINDVPTTDKQLVPLTTQSQDSRAESPSECARSTYRSEAGLSMRVSDEDLTKLSYLNAHDPMLRSYASLCDVPVVAAKSRCIRSKSAVDREVEGMVRSLSRHCCDVLGPKVCHECALLKRRIHDSARHEISLSRLHVSEKNYADSIVLSKLLPHLSPAEIEDRVVSGDISRMSLRERIYETKQRSWRESRRLSSSSMLSTRSHSERRAVKTRQSTPFFINIQDLNCKLLVGRFTNSLSNSSRSTLKSESDYSFRENTLSTPLNTHTQQDKPRYKQWYEPPLLPKVCQNVAPAFFAGQAGTYKLPDRLPDNVVEGQITDMSSFDAAWTGSYPQSEAEDDTTSSNTQKVHSQTTQQIQYN